jgi:hypothetical protein
MKAEVLLADAMIRRKQFVVVGIVSSERDAGGTVVLGRGRAADIVGGR